jgi:SAM-dependent methyltransferase
MPEQNEHPCRRPSAAGGTDDRLLSDRFPRASRYHPEWVIENSFGANPLWLAEWLVSAMDIHPGMRILDLGCGRAKSSIFLAREFGVEVWATDLWVGASENACRIRDAGVQDQVFPIHAEARALPFAAGFFDGILSIDSFSYYGTDDLYLNYLTHFVQPGGQIGVAGAGLVREFDGPVPEHLQSFWTQDCWGLHPATWWREHWARTGLVEVELADTMPDGAALWLDWYRAAHPDARDYMETLHVDGGEYLGYIRMVARRRDGVCLEEYCWPDGLRSLPFQYDRKPFLRDAQT